MARPAIQWLRARLGSGVLIALAASAVSGAWLGEAASEVHTALYQLRNPRLAPEVQELLVVGQAAPQAFPNTLEEKVATGLREEIRRAGKLKAALQFHWRDLLFMGCYGPLLLLAAWWAGKRGQILAGECPGRLLGALGKWIGRLWPVAAIAAVAGVMGDAVEFSICRKILLLDAATPVDAESLKIAAAAMQWKFAGIVVSAVTGGLAGMGASVLTPSVRAFFARAPELWGSILEAHRFALRARFSVLGGALFTILLLTGPGEDIVRTIATGAFEGGGKRDTDPDFETLGWFAVALVVLSATCWGWARLVLAVRFEDRARAASSPMEDRLRRDLPIYYGAVPFVSAACAFAIAPLHEAGREFPIGRFFTASIAPLLLFFLLPLVLVILRADTKARRHEVGPLSVTLIVYGLLALAHFLFEWKHLGLLGLIPLVLLAVALFLFGIGRPGVIFLLPVVLMAGAVWKQQGLSALAPAIALCVLGGLAIWATRKAREMDELHIPKHFPVTELLPLLFSEKPADGVRQRILDDQSAAHEMRQRQAAAKSALETEANLAATAVRQLRGLLQLCAVLTLAQLIFLALTLIAGGAFPRAIGSGAMLALGLGGWVTAGSLLLFVTQATRFPILSVALVVAIGCSGLMDNHHIRHFEAATPPAAAAASESLATRDQLQTSDDPVGDAFSRWLKQARPRSGGGHEPPCIIVAAEGGGIRAAMWPAIVLSTLQVQSLDRRAATGAPDFAGHVFAISGLSGGSVGAAVFAALCAENRQNREMRTLAARICGEDHLAPTLGALLYPDFVQRFLPVGFLPDRAEAFELSWEQAARRHGGSCRMAQPFMALWKNDGPAPWLPALLLNSTMVETGKRTICSHLPVSTAGGGEFIDAHDFHSHLREFGVGAGPWRDVPLSAAAHASARFPIVSPPGRLPSGARVVDGGYFEDSGAATGLDIFNAVRKRRDQDAPDVPLMFIFFRYAQTPGLTDPPEQSGPEPSRPIPDQDPSVQPQRNLLNETGSVAGAVLAARVARGSYAQEAIFHRYLAPENAAVLAFTFRGARIPLSWSLSRRSCDAMLKQFPEDGVWNTTDDQALDEVVRSNVEVTQKLFQLLYPSISPQ